MKTFPTLKLGTLGTLAALALAATPLVGCSDSGDDYYGDTGAGEDGGSGLDPSVGQGGAQDFGRFRELLEAGEIPGPETLDDVGFFNEHQVEMPAADCGDEVCIHGMLGVMGNMISGSNCTIVLMGMNTPIDPDELERPPLNLSIVIDTSNSMQGDPMVWVQAGLLEMLPSLTSEDRINLIGFSDEAEVLAENVAGDSTELGLAVNDLLPHGSTDIYAGLREGFELVDFYAEEGRQNRVLLLSDGLATDGIVNDNKIVELAAAYAEVGYGLSTIGLGSDFDIELMRELSEVGAGSFYFLEDPAAVVEVFTEEAEAFLVPLAEDVRISTSIEMGYDLRAVYGTKRFEISGNSAEIEIPSLQIAHRVSHDDNEGGRRGGGGAMLLELLPTGEDPEAVGEIGFSYRRPGTGEIINQHVEIDSPLSAWETPEDGYFAGDSVEKGFVMLNIFVGFRIASERSANGDFAAALTLLRPLRDNVAQWLGTHDDEDILDDLFYIDLFIQNLETQGGTTLTPDPIPPDPWGEPGGGWPSD